MAKVLLKDPDEVVDFSVDWDAEDWLVEGEAISTSTWSVDPSGELAVDSNSETTTVATAVVSGGEAGKTYRLTNEIVTDQARTGHKSVIVRVEER